jgi:TRAP-type C4-dicarboxylate transport system permease small subunit
MTGRLARIGRVVTGIEIGLAAVVLVLMFALVLFQAAQRYLPFEGLTWTGELARFCLVWLAFVMTGVLVSTDGHIALEMVDLIKRPMVLRVIRVVALLIVAVIGAGFAAEAWDLMLTQTRLKSPALEMPMSWLYVLPLLGFVSTAVRGLIEAWRIARYGVPETTPTVVAAE